MSEAIYTVVGPKSVFGVAPGDSSDFEGVDPGALHALMAGGHIDYAKAPDPLVSDPDQGAAPEPAAPADPVPDAPVAPAVQQEQQAPPAGNADDTSKEA